MGRRNELLFNQKMGRLLSAVLSNKGDVMRVGAANYTYSYYRALLITELRKHVGHCDRQKMIPAGLTRNRAGQ